MWVTAIFPLSKMKQEQIGYRNYIYSYNPARVRGQLTRILRCSMLGGHSIKEQVYDPICRFTRDFILLMMIMSQKPIGANILLILRTTFGALVCGFWDPQGK